VTTNGQGASGVRRDRGGTARKVAASLATLAAAATVVALPTFGPSTDERAHFTDSVLAPDLAGQPPGAAS
jgi:hypothetical protein